MRLKRPGAIVAIAIAILASGCGGGGGPAVNGMSAAPVAYGQRAFWTVSGLNLDGGIGFVITSGECRDLVESAGGTAFQRQFSCVPASLGDIVGRVDDAGGGRLATLRVVVPPPVVKLSLAQGAIDLELDPVRAPLSVENFLAYVNSGFYDGTIVHRIVEDFVVQGGAYTPGIPAPVFRAPIRPSIPLESNNGLSNRRGTLAMARTSAPDSANSQFYINVEDNPGLDYRSDEEPGFAVFGRVIAGLEVVDAIRGVPTRDIPQLGLFNVPLADVLVVTARQVR